MSNVSFPVFFIPFAEFKLDFDFTELQKDDRWIKGTAQRENFGRYDTEMYPDRYRILDKYPQLSRLILSKFFQYTNEIGIDTDFVLTTSWLTKCEKGDTIAGHAHKNCEFSGILYYDDDYTNQPPLLFSNPILRCFTTFAPAPDSGLTTGYTNDWNRLPESGLLLFWPSYIAHSMYAKETSKPRRSLAFNFAPRGDWGHGDSTMNTSWLSS